MLRIVPQTVQKHDAEVLKAALGCSAMAGDVTTARDARIAA